MAFYNNIRCCLYFLEYALSNHMLKQTSYLISVFCLSWRTILHYLGHTQKSLTTSTWNDWVDIFDVCLKTCENSTSHLNLFARYCHFKNSAFWLVNRFFGTWPNKKNFPWYKLCMKNNEFLTLSFWKCSDFWALFASIWTKTNFPKRQCSSRRQSRIQGKINKIQKEGTFFLKMGNAASNSGILHQPRLGPNITFLQ